MANKIKKIKEELIGQYKDYDRMSINGSITRAFERGFGNCEAVYEEAIKKWAKKMDMNASSVLFHIKQEFNDEKIKLK